MRLENTQNNFSSEQISTDKKRKIVIASVDIDDQARDMAEEKMLASKGKLNGVKGFFKKIWKHNLAHEYYRQKELAKARREIQQSGNLYAGENGEKTDHDSAMKAIVERFESEYDKELLREGEDKRILKEENPEGKTTKNIIKDLVKKYATGNLTDEQFNLEKNNLFEKELGGTKDKQGKTIAKKSLLYADNLLEIAKQVKADIAHGKGLDALDLEFDVVVGRAKAGVETQTQYNAVDRIVEKIKNIPGGRLASYFVNETTLASAVAIAYGFGVKGTVSAAQRTAKWIGPLGLGLSAGIGGAVAGVRENKRIKEERTQHAREMAKGKGIEAGSARREEMEKFRYETKSANELNANLVTALTKLQSNPSKEQLDEVLQHINEIDARISYSEREKIDLISFSDAKKVEQERTRMYISTAEAKAVLNKNSGQDWAALYGSEAGLKDYLSRMKEAKIQDIFKKEKTLKDEAFAKMKGKKVAGAVMKGVVIGVGVGMAFQEIQAAIGNSQEGIFSANEIHNSDPVRHFTTAEYLRRYISGDLPTVDAGRLPQTITRHIDGSEQVTNVGTKDYIKSHEDLFSKIKRGHWADNDSLKPDKNELKLWWGGEKETGIDGNGSYVFNVKNMALGGSSHGGAEWNPQKLMQEGKMKLLVSLSGDTQNQVVEIPIDADGNAIINPNSEIGKLAFKNVDGHAKFIGKFAEVAVMGENKGGVEYVDILATHNGEGIENVVDTIKSKAEDIKIVIPGESPSDYDVNWPYAIPVVGRRPMEKLGKKAEAAAATPSSVERLPPQQPEKKKGMELKRVESFLYLLSAVELAALARKKGKVTKEQKETLASLLKALEKTKKPKMPSGVEPTKEQIEKIEKARSAAWHTIYKLANFEELNADTPAEGDQKFLDLTRKLWTEITVHEKPDLDANSCLKLLELAGIKVDMSKVNLVPKGKTADRGIIMDTSEEHGVIADKDGERVIFDHHGKESDRTTSAAKFVYETMVEMGLLQKEEYVDKFVEFVTKCDNKSFTPDEMKKVLENYSKNLYGLSYRMKAEDVLELFKQGVDPMKDFLDDYLKSHEYFNPQNGGKYEPLIELVGFMEKQMKSGKVGLENVEKAGFIVDTGMDRFGKILIDTSKNPQKGRYFPRVDGENQSNQLEVFLKGYGGYLIWSQDRNSFVFYTDKKMDDASIPGGFSQGKNMRGHMLICGEGNTEPVKVEFLQEILAKLSGKADFKIEGKLKKALNTDMAGKEVLGLIDENKLTEVEMRRIMKEKSVSANDLMYDVMPQRYRANMSGEFIKKKKALSAADQRKPQEIEKIAFGILLKYQEKNAAKNQPPAPPAMPQQPPVANIPDAAAEKQKNMAESVKKMSGLFASFELSDDMIKKEASRLNIPPLELAEQFIRSDKKLNSQFEARRGSMEAEKLAMTIILEDEKRSVQDKIKENDQLLVQKKSEIDAEDDSQKKQVLEIEKKKFDDEKNKLETKAAFIEADLFVLSRY